MHKRVALKIASIIEYQGKILMIKEKFLSGTDYKWNIVTGSYNNEDGEILNTLTREIKEEVGLEVEVKGLFKVFFANKENRLKVQFCFAVEAKNDQVILADEKIQAEIGERIVDYKWYDRDEIAQLPESEFVTSSIARIIKEYIENPILNDLNVLKYFDSETSY